MLLRDGNPARCRRSSVLIWCPLMMCDYCLSALLILSSRIGCYRFCGCICTAFNVLLIKLHSKSFPPQLPSSSQGAAACRSSGFFCSYPRIALVALSRIDIPAASRTAVTKTTATKTPLCFCLSYTDTVTHNTTQPYTVYSFHSSSVKRL
jgi:hypothetical protein